MHLPYWQSSQALWAELQRLSQSVEERFVRLEEENRKLKEMIAGIRPLQIDNITYKVQELHVRELSGTLNIGLTALADSKQLEKWLAEQEQSGENPLHDTDVRCGETESRTEPSTGG